MSSLLCFSKLFPVLLIDTSQEKCKLALIEGSLEAKCLDVQRINNLESKTSLFKISIKVFKPENGLAECLDCEVLNLFENANSRVDELKAIFCSFGPGSFTGLRTGLAFCKGLSLGLDVPIVLSSCLLAAYFSGPIDNTEMVHISMTANKEEDFILSIESEKLLKAMQKVTEKSSEIEQVKPRISVVSKALSREANYSMFENLTEVELIGGYLKTYLWSQALSGLNIMLEKMFADQLVICDSKDQIIEPLYVKGVSALTLMERGLTFAG